MCLHIMYSYQQYSIFSGVFMVYFYTDIKWVLYRIT